MKTIFTYILITTILLTSLGCIDKRQQQMGDHIDRSGLNNFKLTPELHLCLQLMAGKTNTSISTVGFKSEFVGETDSIINYFYLKLNQDSADVNHKDLAKTKVLERIAADIKPMVEKYNLFQGIYIELLTKDKEGIIDLDYKQLLSAVPNDGKFTYEFIGDTITFKDYYYNGAQAYSGKVINQKRTGYWTFFYPNGNKKKEGMFVDNEGDGAWKYWTEEGVEEK